MKISGTSDVNKTGASSKKSKSSGSSGAAFTNLLASKMEETHEAPAINSSSPVDMLVAIQEFSGEEESRRQGLQHGKEMLEHLEAIRNGLLIGNIPAEQIQQLQHATSAYRSTVFDPKLKSILEEIEVRAAVELAKLERLSNPST